MSGLEVRGQKIPTPANENSTDFQLGTDDTKGYRGAPICTKHEGCINVCFNLKFFRISLMSVFAMLHVFAVLYTCMNLERV